MLIDKKKTRLNAHDTIFIFMQTVKAQQLIFFRTFLPRSFAVFNRSHNPPQKFNVDKS